MKNQKKILIIEDEKALVEALEFAFSDLNVKIKTYFMGDGAYEEILKVKPDLILLDLVLPGISGFKILEKIKKNKGMKDLPVIVLTNLGEDDDKKKAIELGASDYLVKALIDLEKISQKIKEILK